MNRSKSGMVSHWRLVALLATLDVLSFVNAGPLGPLPMQNITSADMGIKEGSCALGDVVYMPGDEFPGSGPCERCQCAAGSVRCAQQQCEPRPGCKALHRPDHCCPTYQCECEQEGRVYGNGEKLVDPQDPCRVCYCQGGEVVCRRIACFVRDDCTPRLVPGRCCPEYDNCPLRGVTTLPGMTTSLPTVPVSSSEESALPAVTEEVKQQQITIKEITPVSEIPVITDVKIKEILPSPSIEVAEYSSSKSPLIPREATSEKSTSTEFETPNPEPERPSVVEIHSSPESVPTEESSASNEKKSAPSKISLSTQDSINSDIYPSPIVPIVASMGVPYGTPDTQSVASTTKAPMLEEEDPSLFDHNPAFPPLPDDLSVLSNHGDEIVPEPSADADHMPVEHAPTPEVVIASVTSTTERVVKEFVTTTVTTTTDTVVSMTTEKPQEAITDSTTFMVTASTKDPFAKENPTIKLRSAISTEIVSNTSEDMSSGQVSESKETATESDLTPTEYYEGSSIVTQTPITAAATTTTFIITTKAPEEPETTPSEIVITDQPEAPIERVSFLTTEAETEIESHSTTQREITTPGVESTTTEANSTPQDQTTSSIAKSNAATEINSQTELSSLPIETSDQNPHESSVSENVSKETFDISTVEAITETSTITDKPASSAEAVAVAKADSRAIENVETTEFILTSFGSSESSTDAVEMIKIPGGSDKNAAIIDGTDGNRNALTDLIKLVSDVASISDHTDSPFAPHIVSTTYADSEELIPVNAGYKSKNSNFNQNSITEVPFKSKGVAVNKQRVVEIEDDESGHITDSLPPNDKVEPTTRRPIIDNVSDDKPEIKTEKKDIEIISQSYVPTINKRLTKVIAEENKTELSDDIPQDDAPATASSEMVARGSSEAVTESSLELSGGPEEVATGAPASASAEASNATLSVEQ